MCFFFHIGWIWLSVLVGFRRSFASWNQAYGLSFRHRNYVVCQLHFDDSLWANVVFNWNPWFIMDLRGHFILWMHFHRHLFTRNQGKIALWNRRILSKTIHIEEKYCLKTHTQCLKITQNVAFDILLILAFFTNFCLFISDLSGNTVWPHFFGIFNEL